MHGGMKVYAGAPAAARHYVEADRGWADDYYLAEGTGVARRFTTGADGRVQELAPLAGDGYESWVAGLDPDTGEPRGWLRTDAQAVRFVEVVVNGPKSWSLAAALHLDIAAAYDAAQDRAASQVIGWLAAHATTRVGPRGGQVQVPVERLEAVTVAHYTSRAGDPHRHLHLQINARVFAAGRWRGLHTVGARDFLSAINGIGHATVACDPQFRVALAAHGYTLNAAGDVPELAAYAAAFSARAAQIARNVERYERQWTAAHLISGFGVRVPDGAPHNEPLTGGFLRVRRAFPGDQHRRPAIPVTIGLVERAVLDRRLLRRAVVDELETGHPGDAGDRVVDELLAADRCVSVRTT